MCSYSVNMYCARDFKVNWTKIKGGCTSGRKVVPHNSKSDLPLALYVGRYVQIRKARPIHRGLKVSNDMYQEV